MLNGIASTCIELVHVHVQMLVHWRPYSFNPVSVVVLKNEGSSFCESKYRPVFTIADILVD